MTSPCRFLALCALAAAPALAAAQTAPLKADGAFRYALGGGGSYASGWTGTLASANVGGEGVIATTDSRLRFGAKALWSRMIGETASATVCHLIPAGKPAPPRPRKPDALTASSTACGARARALTKPFQPPVAS